MVSNLLNQGLLTFGSIFVFCNKGQVATYYDEFNESGFFLFVETKRKGVGFPDYYYKATGLQIYEAYSFSSKKIYHFKSDREIKLLRFK